MKRLSFFSVSFVPRWCFPASGWRCAWWQGMSAPWNGSVVTYTANTSVTFTGEPRGRPPSCDYGVASPLRAVFSLLWP